MKQKSLKKVRQRRSWRVRKKVQGTQAKPRLSVFISNKHIDAQLIDDENQITLLYLSTKSKDLKNKNLKANSEAAKIVGSEIAKMAKDKGIHSVSFDRGYRSYHGAIKALAEAAREEGLTF